MESAWTARKRVTTYRSTDRWSVAECIDSESNSSNVGDGVRGGAFNASSSTQRASRSRFWPLGCCWSALPQAGASCA